MPESQLRSLRTWPAHHASHAATAAPGMSFQLHPGARSLEARRLTTGEASAGKTRRYCSRILRKHSRQKTSLPWVGSNGTVVGSPSALVGKANPSVSKRRRRPGNASPGGRKPEIVICQGASDALTLTLF